MCVSCTARAMYRYLHHTDHADLGDEATATIEVLMSPTIVQAASFTLRSADGDVIASTDDGGLDLRALQAAPAGHGETWIVEITPIEISLGKVSPIVVELRVDEDYQRGDVLVSALKVACLALGCVIPGSGSMIPSAPDTADDLLERIDRAKGETDE